MLIKCAYDTKLGWKANNPEDRIRIKVGPITFEDVAVHFSPEEWVTLNPDQRVLHLQIMEEIDGILESLGKAPSLMGISVSNSNILNQGSSNFLSGGPIHGLSDC
uniref:KRAB domain-containing protein n=1 Tax=Anolis carolinensis TaxID=28377 RepID=A0A803SX26_ANOCA